MSPALSLIPTSHTGIPIPAVPRDEAALIEDVQKLIIHSLPSSFPAAAPANVIPPILESIMSNLKAHTNAMQVAPPPPADTLPFSLSAHSVQHVGDAAKVRGLSLTLSFCSAIIPCVLSEDILTNIAILLLSLLALPPLQQVANMVLVFALRCFLT